MKDVLKPRDYQQEAITAVFRHLRYNQGVDRNCIVKAATGAGKAFIAAQIAETVTSFEDWRCLIIAHRKELIEQNSADKYYLHPENVTMYSASVGEKDPTGKIVIGQIQSIYKRAHALGKFNLIIIDEVHLYNFEDSEAKTMYGQILSMYKDVPIVGLSATPYRMKEGDIPWEMVYSIEPYELIKKGYLSPIVNKIHDLHLNLSNLSIKQGEYVTKELQNLMLSEDKLERSIATILKWGNDRKCWIVFCVDIEHCFNVNLFLQNAGIKSAMLTSGTPKKEREEIIEKHKSGEITCLVNVMVATVGYDNPRIDLVVLLRPTKSKALAEQMVGRSLRPIYATGYDLETIEGRLGAILFGEKPNSLLLDMANILSEHGGVGSPNYKLYQDGRDKLEKYTHRICPSCESDVLIQATICPECGYEFIKEKTEKQLKHNLDADQGSNVVWNPNNPADSKKSYEIDDVTFELNKGKEGKLDSVRMRYYSGYSDVHSEYLFFKHPEYSFPTEKTISLLNEWALKQDDIDFLFESLQPEIDLSNFLAEGRFGKVIKIDIQRQKKNPKYFETVKRYYEGGYEQVTEELDDEIPF